MSRVRSWGAVLIALIVVGVSFTLYWGQSAEADDQIPALHSQLALVAGQFGMVPELPPATEIRPTFIVARNRDYVPDCWTADTMRLTGYKDIITAAIDARLGEFRGVARYVRKFRSGFSSNAQSADSVRFKFTDLSVTTASNLRFQWTREGCWLAVRSGNFSVISGVLRFGGVEAEGIRSNHGAVAVDSSQLTRVVKSMEGRWVRTNSGHFAMTGTSLVIGSRRREFGVRQLTCPASGVALINSEFQSVGPCETYDGAGPWYRARLEEAGDSIILVAVSQDYPDGRTVHLPVIVGNEALLLERAQNLDRVIVERRGTGYAVRFIRWEIYEIEPAPQVLAGTGFQLHLEVRAGSNQVTAVENVVVGHAMANQTWNLSRGPFSSPNRIDDFAYRSAFPRSLAVPSMRSQVQHFAYEPYLAPDSSSPMNVDTQVLLHPPPMPQRVQMDGLSPFAVWVRAPTPQQVNAAF